MKNKLIIFFLAFFTFISIIAIWPDSGKDHDAGLTSAELKLENYRANIGAHYPPGARPLVLNCERKMNKI